MIPVPLNVRLPEVPVVTSPALRGWSFTTALILATLCLGVLLIFAVWTQSLLDCGTLHDQQQQWSNLSTKPLT